MRPSLYQGIQNYFGFRPAEARGFLVLSGLLALLLLLPLLYGRLPDTVPDTAATDARRLDTLVAQLSLARETSLRQRYARPREHGDFDPSGPSLARPARLFAFNPNEISAAQWQQLGLPRWLAQRIEHYRSKGGQFRRKEDVQRIYDFPPELYARLAPYIRLPEQTAAPRPDFPVKAVSSLPGKRPAFSGKPGKRSFDLNEADTTVLIGVYGIGSKRAANIIRYREALGGFHSLSQVQEIYTLDSASRQELLKYATLENGRFRKINLNEITAENFRHPYLKAYQIKGIIAYRQQHGPFRSAEDLQPIRVLDAPTLERIKPYLTF